MKWFVDSWKELLRRLNPSLTRFLQLAQFGKLPVIGGSNCKSVTKTPAHGEEFKIGDRITVRALHTPCHTQDSICYFMQDGDQRVVFTGDTLFIGGKSMMNCVDIKVSLQQKSSNPIQAVGDSLRVMPQKCTEH